MNGRSLWIAVVGLVVLHGTAFGADLRAWIRSSIDLQNRVAMDSSRTADYDVAMKRFSDELDGMELGAASDQEIATLLLLGLSPRSMPREHMDRPYTQAILSFENGQLDLLRKLDLSSMDEGLLTPLIAFAQAESDPEDMRKFRRAAALAPASAVEEAALRRILDMELRAENMSQAATTIRRYFRLYERSPFAKNLKELLFRSLLGASDRTDADAGCATAAVLSRHVGQTFHVETMLELSRTHVLKSQWQRAQECAGIALAATQSGTPEHMRASLYRAAADFDLKNVDIPLRRMSSWDGRLLEFLKRARQEFGATGNAVLARGNTGAGGVAIGSTEWRDNLDRRLKQADDALAEALP